MKLLKINNVIAMLSVFWNVHAGIIEGYEDGVLSFSGTYEGIPFEANGTAQSILSQAQALYPNVQLSESSTVSTRDGLFDRGVSGRICVPVAGQSWRATSKYQIQNGISYLRGLSGKCQINARTCVRISCSWSSAIFWCNDANYWREGDCWYLANYAEDICNSCTTSDDGELECGGQIFDSDAWNIIVTFYGC